MTPLMSDAKQREKVKDGATLGGMCSNDVTLSNYFLEASSTQS